MNGYTLTRWLENDLVRLKPHVGEMIAKTKATYLHLVFKIMIRWTSWIEETLQNGLCVVIDPYLIIPDFLFAVRLNPNSF